MVRTKNFTRKIVLSLVAFYFVGCQSGSLQHSKASETVVQANVANIDPMFYSQDEYCGREVTELCLLEYHNYEKAVKLRDLLYQRKWLVLSAESLTAGNFAGLMGKLNHASGGLAGAVVSYNTSIKNAVLKVTSQDDVAVMSDEAALEMVSGLHKIATDMNQFQDKRKASAKAMVLISFTGATTTWNSIKPHVHIAVQIGEAKPIVKVVQLDQTRMGSKSERLVNIQNAISAGLDLLIERLSGLEQK